MSTPDTPKSLHKKQKVTHCDIHDDTNFSNDNENLIEELRDLHNQIVMINNRIQLFSNKVTATENSDNSTQMNHHEDIVASMEIIMEQNFKQIELLEIVKQIELLEKGDLHAKKFAKKFMQQSLQWEVIEQNIEACTNSNVFEALHQMMAASNQLGIPDLRAKANRYALLAMAKNKSVSPACFAACDRTLLARSQTETTALNNIRYNPKMLLDTKGALDSLSDVSLEILLKDAKMMADEYTLFQILVQWTKVGSTDDHTKRQEKALKLIEHIALEKISPTHLNSVRKSGLVSADQFLDIHECQAKKQSESKEILDYNKLRYVGWRSSGSHVLMSTGNRTTTDSIEGVTMASPGIYKWSYLIEMKAGTHFSWTAGIISASTPLSSQQTLENQTGSWCITNQGYVYPRDGNVFFSSAGGCISNVSKSYQIEFTLNLSGTKQLHVSIDGQSKALPGSERITNDGGGFKIAASCYGCSLRILTFRKC